MEINVQNLTSDSASAELIEYLQNNEATLNLADSQVYYDFPLYRDEAGGVMAASLLVLSPRYGVIAIQTSNITERENVDEAILAADDELGKVYTAIFSRLVRQEPLRRDRRNLKFEISGLMYFPNLGHIPTDIDTEFEIFITSYVLEEKLESIDNPALDSDTFSELVAVVEGAKGLVRPKTRDIESTPKNSKGNLANKVEAAILSFDRQQKLSSIISSFDGPQRIRGLAGSGKTVILALKAALTHLRYPDATIVYTFYTRSLYQHIRHLITRFYREYHEQDPDWSKLLVMHAWGGKTTDGLYYNACVANQINPLTYSEARSAYRRAPFDYACRQLIKTAKPKPIYDYIFVDEGQDFPASFINLCVRLAKDRRVAWAYDDLQTIFQPHAPTPEQVFGTDDLGNPRIEMNLDTVLYKCYRNPREVLVCAHALGFGIYQQIVQMLENKDHWEDIGYVVRSGDFIEGSKIEIERPPENSLSTISEEQSPEDIVSAFVFDSFEEEIEAVSDMIADDIKDGLRPDDILIIAADDRNASGYLSSLAKSLGDRNINTNNIHTDSFGIRDFQRPDQVTLSTIHKAKGNEAFMVYVVGVDALFSSFAGVRERNMLFTSMTRAKGWVRVSGIGAWAESCKKEIEVALKNYPYLRFEYPSEEELKIMKRDLTEQGVRKLQTERLLERVMEEMDPDEIARFVEQRSLKKGDDK